MLSSIYHECDTLLLIEIIGSNRAFRLRIESGRVEKYTGGEGFDGVPRNRNSEENSSSDVGSAWDSGHSGGFALAGANAGDAPRAADHRNRTRAAHAGAGRLQSNRYGPLRRSTPSGCHGSDRNGAAVRRG